MKQNKKATQSQMDAAEEELRAFRKEQQRKMIDQGNHIVHGRDRQKAVGMDFEKAHNFSFCGQGKSTLVNFIGRQFGILVMRYYQK